MPATMTRPAHALVFLPFGNSQVICFFDRIAGNTQPEPLADGIASDGRLLAFQITNQFLSLVLGLYVGSRQTGDVGNCTLNISSPENTQKLTPYLTLHISVCLSAFECHTQDFVAMFPQMEPIQNNIVLAKREDFIYTGFDFCCPVRKE